MRPDHVQNSLMQAFRSEFAGQMAAVRRDWSDYLPGTQNAAEGLAELRRELHTVKGSVRLLQLAGLAERVHALEELVVSALREGSKPETFLDALSDLEVAVAQALGEEGAPDGAAAESVEMQALSPRPQEVGGNSAYSLLLALDELLGLGEELSEELGEQEDLPIETVAARLASMVERVRAIRQGARTMALLPSHELFAGLSELARRAAAEQSKQVRVNLRVAPDQLERETVLALRPALIHLVGNAVSHGIPGISGNLELTYRRLPSHLEISVSDQGDGLDLDRLKEAVIGAGHLDEEGWGKLSVSEQRHWIFSPGLSTRGNADLTAGRGMGLSAVAETIQRLNGSVSVESTSGGTTFRLEVPAGWEMRSVLRVTSEGQDFAVLSSELLGVGSPKASTEHSALWLGELGSLLGYPQTGGRASYALMWKRDEEQALAVGIERLGLFDEVLVCPLIGFSGLDSAVIGVTPTRGRPVPVISLRALRGQGRAATLGAIIEPATAEGPLLLVVDDSVTTRLLVSSILSSQGYRVLLAQDGVEGLEMSRNERVDLVVSDYQMPHLDGLEFLEQFRADARTAEVPFILLTSIDDVATFEKASALGADRCLGKQNFSQDRLLRLVEELL